MAKGIKHPVNCFFISAPKTADYSSHAVNPYLDFLILKKSALSVHHQPQRSFLATQPVTPLACRTLTQPLTRFSVRKTTPYLAWVTRG